MNTYLRSQPVTQWRTYQAQAAEDPAARLARNLAGLDAYIRNRRQRGIPKAGLPYGHRRGMSFDND